HARHREVELEMTKRVPGEAGHPVARLDAELRQRGREPASTLDHLAVAGPLDPLLGAGDELPLGEQPLGAFGELLDEKRAVHHQPFHCEASREPAPSGVVAGLAADLVAEVPDDVAGGPDTEAQGN